MVDSYFNFKTNRTYNIIPMGDHYKRSHFNFKTNCRIYNSIPNPINIIPMGINNQQVPNRINNLPLVYNNSWRYRL